MNNDKELTKVYEEIAQQKPHYGDIETGTYIKFIPTEPLTKTSVWRVHSKEDPIALGIIKWFARWRKYCFFPITDTVYEQVCLREIADFIERKTKEHKS